MQESAIMQLVTQIETSVAQRKLYNYGRYSREYIPFGFEGDLWQARETVGYRENIQRIPASCFMTVELCHPAECVSEYMLATYTPCQLPLMKKCTAYYGDREEEELHRHDYYEMIYVYQGMRTTMIEDQEIVLREKELCIFDTRCAHLDIRSKSKGIAFYLCLNEKQIDGYFLNLLENKQVRDFFVTDEKQKTGVSYLCLKAKPENQTAIEDCIAQSFRELEASMAGTERMVQIFTLRLLNQYPAEATSELYVCRKNKEVP